MTFEPVPSIFIVLCSQWLLCTGLLNWRLQNRFTRTTISFSQEPTESGTDERQHRAVLHPQSETVNLSPNTNGNIDRIEIELRIIPRADPDPTKRTETILKNHCKCRMKKHKAKHQRQLKSKRIGSKNERKVPLDHTSSEQTNCSCVDPKNQVTKTCSVSKKNALERDDSSVAKTENACVTSEDTPATDDSSTTEASLKTEEFPKTEVTLETETSPTPQNLAVTKKNPVNEITAEEEADSSGKSGCTHDNTLNCKALSKNMVVSGSTSEAERGEVPEVRRTDSLTESSDVSSGKEFAKETVTNYSPFKTENPSEDHDFGNTVPDFGGESGNYTDSGKKKVTEDESVSEIECVSDNETETVPENKTGADDSVFDDDGCDNEELLKQLFGNTNSTAGIKVLQTDNILEYG